MKKATDASIDERGARFIGDVYMRGPSPENIVPKASNVTSKRPVLRAHQA